MFQKPKPLKPSCQLPRWVTWVNYPHFYRCKAQSNWVYWVSVMKVGQLGFGVHTDRRKGLVAEGREGLQLGQVWVRSWGPWHLRGLDPIFFLLYSSLASIRVWERNSKEEKQGWWVRHGLGQEIMEPGQMKPHARATWVYLCWCRLSGLLWPLVAIC